MNSYCHF